MTCGAGSCSRIRPRTCRAGSPASTRCTSSAASSACPAREPPSPASPGAAREFASAVGYPLIAKLTTPWTAGSGLRSTSVRGRPAGTGPRLPALRTQSGAGLMLQEFIPGGPGHDWFFHGYCDASSVCQPAFTGIKERSYPGRSRADQPRALGGEREAARSGHLAARQAWATADCSTSISAWTRATAQYNLLDFNPRLGAQFRVFRDTAGTDVAAGRLPRPDRPADPAG